MLVVVTLTFIDRFNMNVAAKYIQQEFSLSNVQIGSLLSAFVLGYAAFQAPGRWLGDRIGNAPCPSRRHRLVVGFHAL